MEESKIADGAEQKIAALEKAAQDAAATHARVSAALSNKVQQLETGQHMHMAEKDALGQSVQELMGNNVRLRATCILLEKQVKAGFDEKDAQIKRLSEQLAAKDAEIVALKAEIAKLNVELQAAHCEPEPREDADSA